MGQYSVVAGCLFVLMLALGASATSPPSEVNATCEGTLIITMGADGPDQLSAVKGTFKMTMKGETSTFSLENKFAAPLKGTGVESGTPDKPWNFQGKDDSGRAFKGSLRALKSSYSSDPLLHVIPELKSTNVMISGPMSCTMK